MKAKKFLSVYVMLIGMISLIGCSGCLQRHDEAVSVIKNDVETLGLSENIAQLGQEIADYQRSEVWRGGNQYTGCYMWIHRKKFLDDDGLSKIRKQALKNKSFLRGIISLKSVDEKTQYYILTELKEPIDSTWVETGQIGNGTTYAGQETESDIANELVDLIQELLPKTDKEIKQVWLDNLSGINRSWKKLFGTNHLVDK